VAETLRRFPDDISVPLRKRVAETHPNRAVRREALEGLAEKASDRVVGTPERFAFEERDDPQAIKLRMELVTP
jgi:hypothetical protein